MEILGQAHIGIASLALHRKKMQEASPLKLREYLAAGLPSITAYRDTDFPDGAPFLLELPNTADNIPENLQAIDSFVDSQAGHRVPRGSIAHLGMREKEAARLAFLEAAAAGWRQQVGS